MPYCKNCGKALREDEKYCPSCGTYTGPTPEKRRMGRERRRPVNTLAIFLIILVFGAAIIFALASLPVRMLDVARQHTVPHVWAGMDTLNVDLSAEVAGVDVAFERRTQMGEELALSIEVFATARVGIFGAPDFLKLTSQNAIDGNVLTVTSEIDLVEPSWPSYTLTNVTCVIRIDPSLNTTLNLRTDTGGIVVHTQAGVVLDSLSLEVTTGGIEVALEEDVFLSGDISLKAETGDIQFSWDNVLATKTLQVDATTTTGGVDVDVKQDERFHGNITLIAEATTGGVNFALDIQGDIGSKIDSRVTTGGIDIDRQVGFSLVYSSPNQAGLLSDNHPAGNNFDVNLRTATGGIDIDARHTPIYGNEYDTLYDFSGGVGIFEKGIHVIATSGNPLDSKDEYELWNEYWQWLKSKETERASTEDFISIIISRGDYPTGGYTIQVESFSWLETYPVKFRFHVNFTDPGEGVPVTEAFTNPLVLFPISELDQGEYVVEVHIVQYIMTFDEEGNPIYTQLQTLKEEVWTLEFVIE